MLNKGKTIVLKKLFKIRLFTGASVVSCKSSGETMVVVPRPIEEEAVVEEEVAVAAAVVEAVQLNLDEINHHVTMSK